MPHSLARAVDHKRSSDTQRSPKALPDMRHNRGEKVLCESGGSVLICIGTVNDGTAGQGDDVASSGVSFRSPRKMTGSLLTSSEGCTTSLIINIHRTNEHKGIRSHSGLRIGPTQPTIYPRLFDICHFLASTKFTSCSSSGESGSRRHHHMSNINSLPFSPRSYNKCLIRNSVTERRITPEVKYHLILALNHEMVPHSS